MLGLLCDCVAVALAVTGMATILGQVTLLGSERWLVLVVTLTSGPTDNSKGE